MKLLGSMAHNAGGLLSVLDVCDPVSPEPQPVVDLLLKINYYSQIGKRPAGTEDEQR